MGSVCTYVDGVYMQELQFQCVSFFSKALGYVNKKHYMCGACDLYL